MFVLREARQEDMDAVLTIVAQCQALMAQRGIDQWQDGYPNRTVIAEDIALCRGYILEQNQQVAAYAALVFDGEPAYDALEGGEWLQQGSYVTVHRMCVSDNFRGQKVGENFFNHIAQFSLSLGVDAVRVDTHPDNQVMLALLGRIGFVYCGVVHYNALRVAFERLLI